MVVFLYKIESTSKRITFVKKYDTIVLQKVTKYLVQGLRVTQHGRFDRNVVTL